jgi:hypothetical protein
MSVLRDATNTNVAPNVAYPTTNTDNPTDEAQGPEGTGHAPLGISDATRDAIKARTDLEADDAKQRKFQADFNKRLEDVPGFGAKETDEAKGLKGAFTQAGLPQPSAQNVNTVAKAVGNDKNYQAMVSTVSKALSGEGAVPTAAQWTGMLNKTMASTGLDQAKTAPHALAAFATVGAGVVGAPAASEATANNAPAAQPNQGASEPAVNPGTGGEAFNPTPAQAAALQNAGPVKSDGTTAGATKENKLPSTSGNNYTAMVFLVMLEAQEETKKEKNDTLRKIKMYNGMLDQVNKLVTDTLVPAQKKYADLTKEAGDKKSSQVRVAVEFPTDIDTDHALMDEKGSIHLATQWGDGSTPARANLDNNGLAALSKTADGWRQSIQNNQQTESNRYQSQDNNMSSTMNIINAILKNSHEGVSAIVRNV